MTREHVSCFGFWLMVLALAPLSDAATQREDTVDAGFDPVQLWSSRVLEHVEGRLKEAEHAAQLLQQMRQADPLPPATSFSNWPRAYADVLYREMATQDRSPSLSPMPFPRLGLADEVSIAEGGGDGRRNRPGGHHRMREFGPLVLSVLRNEGLPPLLLAVPLIESGFNPWALSPKGARGLWQLMPETARRFGLNPDGPFDERLNPERSTVAAARYLKELYQLWGDWSLALAAYNAGEGRVQQALARSRSRDFRTLAALGLLPKETRSYVPSVLAAARRISQLKGTGGQVPTQSFIGKWGAF